MQRRVLFVLAIAGALAGLAILLALFLQSPPEIDRPLVYEPEQEVPETGQEIPRAVRRSGTFKGSVVNGNTDKAIPGATVIALRPYLDRGKDDDVPLWGQMLEVKRVVTDSKGQFVIADLPPDFWNLWVEKKSYGWTTVPRADFKTSHLIKLYPGCTLWGKVIYEDGQPAEGVRIEYTPQGTHSEVFGQFRLKSYYVNTRKDGTFLYEDLPPGKFTVEAYSEDHLPSPWTAELPLKPGEFRRLPVHKLDRGFGMKVRVLWRGSEEPVQGIDVVVLPVGDPMPRTKTGQTRTTDINGLARFQGLGGQVMENPRFMITANPPGGDPVMPEKAGLIDPDHEVTIYLRKDGLIKGRVLGPGGDPLDRFHVSLEPIGFITRQIYVFGKRGKFEIHRVPEGQYRVRVRHGNLVEAERIATSVAGRETDIGTVTLVGGAEIHGTVRNADGSELTGVVRVQLVREIVDVRTGQKEFDTVKRGVCKKDGSYSLRGVPEGSYKIQPLPELVLDINPAERIEVPRGSGAIQRDLVLYAAGYVDFVFEDLVAGSVRRVVAPPIRLIHQQTAEIKPWTGNRTPFKPGVYAVQIDLEQEDGALKRYDKVVEITIRPEASIQEAQSREPIRISLHEIRNGG